MTAGLRGAVVLLALTLLLSLPGALRAQHDAVTLSDRCAERAPTLAGHCLEAALATQAIQGALGLGLGGGSDTPGASSTMGRRLGATPRIALSLRIAGTWSDAPDVVRDQEPPVRGEGFFTGSLEGRAAVGVFHGFSPLPTVGGILSLDLLGTAGVALFPSDFGFHGNVGSVGLGARLGLLRESFGLPGVSLSAVRRWAGTVELGRGGAMGAGIGAAVVDPTMTSIRAVVGKDLLAVGLLAGMGWERYSGRARIQVSPEGHGVQSHADLEEFDSDRILYFGGVSMTWLILQLSAEAGWTGGYFDLPDRGDELYDPADGDFFASLGLRLTI